MGTLTVATATPRSAIAFPVTGSPCRDDDNDMRRALVILALFAAPLSAQEPKTLPPPTPVPTESPNFTSIPTLLGKDRRPIDLPSALQLAGVQNPEIMLARERIVEAAALRQLAAAQFLPNLNGGGNLDHHNGTLQDSN